MSHHRKSYKQMIKARLQEQVKTVSLTARLNPHQASCQGLSTRYWWPKKKAIIIIKGTPGWLKAITN